MSYNQTIERVADAIVDEIDTTHRSNISQKYKDIIKQLTPSEKNDVATLVAARASDSDDVGNVTAALIRGMKGGRSRRSKKSRSKGKSKRSKSKRR